MNREYPANSVFIQVQSERQVDLLGDAGAAESRIALLHLYDGFDDFSGSSFWTRCAAAAW